MELVLRGRCTLLMSVRVGAIASQPQAGPSRSPNLGRCCRSRCLWVLWSYLKQVWLTVEFSVVSSSHSRRFRTPSLVSSLIFQFSCFFEPHALWATSATVFFTYGAWVCSSPFVAQWTWGSYLRVIYTRGTRKSPEWLLLADKRTYTYFCVFSMFSLYISLVYSTEGRFTFIVVQ